MLSVIGHPVPRLLAPQDDRVMTHVTIITANNKIFFMLMGFDLIFSIFCNANIQKLYFGS
jgi:hypothetical protein